MGSGKIGEGVGVSAPRGVTEGARVGVSALKTVGAGVWVAVAASVGEAGGCVGCWVGVAVAGAGTGLPGSD